MSDDWRLRIVLDDRRIARELADGLASGTTEHELDDGYTDRVIVSVDESEVFVYAGSREQAERGREAIAKLAHERGWRLTALALERWHPIAEEWEDPEDPLPQDSGTIAAEHDELIAEERVESAQEGYPGWEVRVECGSHHDTVALSERFDADGLAHVRRWRYILLGAVDEDSANELADRVRPECPAGSTVTVEATLPAIASKLPPNPFAVFGGLGG